MLKNTLKRALPDSMVAWIKTIREKADILTAVIASRYKWSAVMYYVFLTSEFHREMHSVLLARRRYYQARSGEKPTSFLLRRNVHRLEKGLIMRPRRSVFAEGYIQETIDYLEICIKAQCLTDSELIWTNAVLKKYFETVEFSEIIDNAHSSYHTAEKLLANVELRAERVPTVYSELAVNKSNVSFNDFKILCESRHSVRWFSQESVPRDLLDSAIAIAATAPSACNRQPFKFYVFDDPIRAQEIGSIPMGTAGFAHNFQAIVVVVGDLSAYPFEKDRHIIYIDAGLAIMQFQLALETQGLASCSINWPDIEHHERQMMQELDLEIYERPVLLVAVGYPLAEGKVPYSAKKTASDIAVRPK